MKPARFVVALVLFVSMLSTLALAASTETIEVHRNYVNFQVNGRPVAADTFLYDGTTYVPIQVAAEALGARVGWDDATKTLNLLTAATETSAQQCPETGTTPATAPTQKAITYDRPVNYLEPTFGLGLLNLRPVQIEAVRLERDGKPVEVRSLLSIDTLTLKVENYLEPKTPYTLKLYLADGGRRVVRFQTSDLLALEPGNDQKIILVPAAPEKGFNYPYYLVLPSKKRVDLNKGKRNYLLVETHNTGQVGDSLTFHIAEAMKIAQSNSASIAEELGLPRIVPILVRPESTIHGQHIYTHALTRKTMLLEQYKRQAGTYDPVFEPMDRVDLQVIAMIDHANAYLEANGWQMEEKIFMWGFSASGSFTNHFTFLHPHRVKAAIYGGFPVLPLARAGGYNLIYPHGTYDYKEITGRSFDLQAYNNVAKLGYIGSEDHNNPTLMDDMYTGEEKAIIEGLLAVREYPDRWNRYRELFATSGGQAQANVYIGAGHVTFYKGMTLDYLNFFKANRESDRPVYVRPSQPDSTLTDIYSENVIEVKADITGYEKTTIDDAWWSGSAPTRLHIAIGGRWLSFPGNEYAPGAFFVSVAEWDTAKGREQMDERLRAVGGPFTLRADGHKDVTFTLSPHMAGTLSGIQHQIYLATVENPQDLASGVAYRIIPPNAHWVVPADLRVTRP
ncbi:MAG: stalk domain-containing protein [Bacillota bacterium]